MMYSKQNDTKPWFPGFKYFTVQMNILEIIPRRKSERLIMESDLN